MRYKAKGIRSRGVRIFSWILLMLVILFFAALVFFYFKSTPNKNPSWGLNFSSRHVTYLGMDWKKVYLNMLTEFKPKYLRIPAYWEEIENTRGRFAFSDLDFQLTEAGKRGVKVIVVVGKKQPRWPECHFPGWYKKLNEDEQRAALKNYIRKTVEHFKSFNAVEIWQVENEPIFGFGPDCPKITEDQLREEIKLVKSVDDRPVIVTDSGELGRWLPTASSGADYFGSTMYRVVHNPKVGYYSYHLPSTFFRVKTGILNTFHRPQKLFGVELQAEPWFATDVLETDLARQNELMNASIFKDNIEYARNSGFERHYLWGTEWWYWMKEKNNDPSVWNEAKKVFEESNK